MVLLAGGVAHDFNNILAVILGNTDLALASLDEPAITREALEDVRSAALRAAELARQMLVYAGKAESRHELVALGPLTDDTVKLLRGSVGATSLRCIHDPALPPVDADPTRIRQVVMNLVINASDAIGGEPGSIRVATYPVHAEEPWWGGAHLVPLEPGGDFVCLEVADTGCGMEPSVLSRIFDPFFSTKFPGRGLGLATTIGIVRSQGGGIRVTSEPGQGTRFRVYFRAASGA
jgi:signal transduction histidine kinase